MPHLRKLACWAGSIIAAASLAACGDQPAPPEPAESLELTTSAPAANAVELNALDTSAQSAALSSASPQETADAGNSVLTDAAR